MRAEVAITLSIIWNPVTPLAPRDIPTVRNFLSAVKGMMRLPGQGVSLTGPVSMLEAAFERTLPVLADDQGVARPVTTFADVERATLRNTLAAMGGNRTRAARGLGVSRHTITNLLNKHPEILAEFPPSKPWTGSPVRLKVVAG